MKALFAVLLCISALTVEGAPDLSESFTASLLVQYIGGSCLSTLVRDASAGKEYWTLLNEPENIYAGQLFDYPGRMSYNILQFGPLQGCLPLPANGTLPKFWDWLPSAKDAGKQEYMNTVVDVWAGMDSAGNYREVGVSVADSTRPVYTVISTHRTSVQFTWQNYTPSAAGADFSVPMECTMSAQKKSKAMGGMMNLFSLGLPNFRL